MQKKNTMNQQEIKTIVTETLIDKLRILETEISPETTMKDYGADSLDEVEIIMQLEKKFGIEIPDDFNPEERNIGGLCKYIEKKLSQRKPD